MPMLEHALALAQMGFRVFPLFSNTKRPAIMGFPDKATTDSAQIQTWWSGKHVETKGEKRWVVPANANIGIETTGLFVIDVDVRPEYNGFDTLTTIAPAVPVKTFVCKSPTGGAHFMYQLPANAQPRACKSGPWLQGIDIKSWHSFVVGAGSVRKAGAYEWVSMPDGPMPEVPADVWAKYQAGHQTAGASEGSDFGEYRHDYSKIPDVIPAGERDTIIFGYACSWRERGLRKSEAKIILKELFAAIEQRPDDSFTWEDAVAKLDHAWSAYDPGGSRDPARMVQPATDQVATTTVLAVQEMINRYVFIIEGSRVADLHAHPSRAVIKLDEFKNAMRASMRGKSEVVNIWLRSPERQTVRDVGYFPQEGLRTYTLERATFFNTYHGPDLEVPDEPDPGILKPMMEHLAYLYPRSHHQELLLDWMAFTVQYPHLRVPWCYLTLSTQEGVGKEIIYSLMAQCVGAHNAIMVPPGEIADKGGSFNGYMAGKTLVCWDEIRATSDVMESLKMLITAKRMLLNHKYGAKREEPLYANTMGLSNHKNSIQLTPGDRRFFVTCCHESPKSRYYYDRLWLALDGDLPAHWLCMLKSRDLGKFSWSSAPPETSDKRLMRALNIDPVEELYNDCVAEKIGPFAADIVDAVVAKNFLESHGIQRGVEDREVSVKKVGMLLSRSQSLPLAQYTVPGVGRVRCRCIRNFDYWALQPSEAVVTEYLRAREIGVKGMAQGRALVAAAEPEVRNE